MEEFEMEMKASRQSSPVLVTTKTATTSRLYTASQEYKRMSYRVVMFAKKRHQAKQFQECSFVVYSYIRKVSPIKDLYAQFLLPLLSSDSQQHRQKYKKT